VVGPAVSARQLNRQLLALGGLGVAVVLAGMWFSAHGAELHPRPGGIGWMIGIGAALLPVAVWLQIVRTGWLFGMGPRNALRQLAQPLLYAHGMNVLLPSMLGDLFEMVAVSRRVKRPVRRVLAVLLHRFTGTVTALTVLAAMALVGPAPSVAIPLGVGAVMGYLWVDHHAGRWSRWLRIPGTPQATAMTPYGIAATLGHLGLSLTQHLIEVLAVFALAIGLGVPISPGAAAGMVSIVEMVTYLPIPLAGAGANHWGASSVLDLLGAAARTTAVLVAATHALQVLVGAISVAVGIGIPAARDVTQSDPA
jgi:hypothetical protein